MSDDATPRLALPYLAAAQAQKHVTMNAALALLDGLVQTAVESRSVSVEPATPADGAIYILPTSASGADWASHGAGTLMRFEAGAWAALESAPGWIVYVKDEGLLLVQTSGGWSDVGLGIRDLGLIRFKSVDKAVLPSAMVQGAGAIAFVPDESGGAIIAFSDGSNWRRVSDRAVVS
jgi:hypothetical protein